jgi:hypothetical protein
VAPARRGGRVAPARSHLAGSGYHGRMPFQLDPAIVALLALLVAAPVSLVGMLYRTSREAVNVAERELDARERGAHSRA